MMACKKSVFYRAINIRELQNEVEQRILLSENGLVTYRELAREIVNSIYSKAPGNGMPTLKELETQYIVQVLKQVDGNQSRAAKILGINRKTLYQKLNVIQMATSKVFSGSLLHPLQ